MDYEAVIGLEIHAELLTNSKMFCSCPVVDLTTTLPNTAVCPVCAGMPGVLPVVNQRAVEFALRVALALECTVYPFSVFARKNYFYPDLPKGYQISQYEQPLARNGRLVIQTSQGERTVRIRRVHLEEDTAKLTHVHGEDPHSLVDLNRAGIPLLEIVTEPDLHTAEEVRVYAMALRSLLRYLGVNSGDMQKGVMRIEPNVSVRRFGSNELGTRVEIKNLNSFRALERAIDYEIKRQTGLLNLGKSVHQETLGWDVENEVTFTQRVKEGEEDYRYFPEPDLPPLELNWEWIENVRSSLPELPIVKKHRFEVEYGLSAYDADVLVEEPSVAGFFEQTVACAPDLSPKMIANWITGELFGLLNQAGLGIDQSPISEQALAALIHFLGREEINNTTAKTVLNEMFQTGQSAEVVISKHQWKQISDRRLIAAWVDRVISENPDQVTAYLEGKETVSQWLFGKVMRLAQGQANPQVVQAELESRLEEAKRLHAKP